ncbi:MAG: hypothetical protein RL283_236 [Actinomycetota bacterium]|jgi:hypothetical protein
MTVISGTGVRGPRRTPVVAEALSYVGGTLGIVGLILFAVRSWDDFTVLTRLVISGFAAGAFGVGGLAISDDSHRPAIRLREFLWVVATGCVGVFASVIGAEWLDAGEDPRRVLVVAVGVALASGLMWWWRSGVAQEITGLGAVLVATAAAAQELWGTGVAGTTVWFLGGAVVWLAVTAPVPVPWLTGSLGAIGAIVGALYAADEWTGPGLIGAVLTAAALLWIVLLVEAPGEGPIRLAFSIIGIAGLVQSVPPAIVYFADQAGVNTGLVVVICGVLLAYGGYSDLAIGGAATTAIGAVTILAGAAITGAESPGFATIFGTVLAALLVLGGTTPGHVLVSAAGLAGLVAFVPWGVVHFFPGEDRVPLVVFIVGVLITGSGLLLRRLARRRA